MISAAIMLVLLAMLLLPGCASNQDNQADSTTGEELLPVADTVRFMEGIDGRVVLTNKDLAGFYISRRQDTMTGGDVPIITFQLTEQAQKPFYKLTKQLSETAGSISLWIGNEMIVNPVLYEPIEDGEFNVSGGMADDVDLFSQALQGKTPGSTTAN